MFERFTDRARRVLVLAQEEARLLDHNFIGTEHILLGLIHEGEGVAAKALESIGISLETVREKVIETVGPAGSPATGSPEFTPRAKKVLEFSLREALQLGHNYIGTEHLLLGLLREGEGVAAQVLVGLGAELSRIRQEVIRLVSGYAPRAAVASPQARTPAAVLTDVAARRLARGLPVGTHHVLVALFEPPDSLAAKVLASLNVDRSVVEERVAQLGVAGTSDELPDAARGRRVDVAVVEGRVVVTVDDADLAELVSRGLSGGAAASSGERLAFQAGDAPPVSFAGIWTAIHEAGADLVRRTGTPEVPPDR
jgi:ATP-dependent Clp protease ATP-binding subunit ClpA